MPVVLINWNFCYFHTDCRITYFGKHCFLDNKNINCVHSSTAWRNRSIWWHIRSTIKTLQLVMNHFICTQQIIYLCILYLRKVIHRCIRSVLVYLDSTGLLCSKLSDHLQKLWTILPYRVFCNYNLSWQLCQQCHFLTSSLSVLMLSTMPEGMVWNSLSGPMHIHFIFSYNFWSM